MYSNKNEFIAIYNEKVKAKALDNDAYRKILEGIVEVICVGEEESEIKSSLVQIMSTWVIYLSQAKTKLEVGVSKFIQNFSISLSFSFFILLNLLKFHFINFIFI
jgi:hypothetical protein